VITYSGAPLKTKFLFSHFEWLNFTGHNSIQVVPLGGRVTPASPKQSDEGWPMRARMRRETVEHPFGTIKARMGATHFLTKTLLRVAAEMALHARLQSHPPQPMRLC
jgi:hypothetical protein